MATDADKPRVASEAASNADSNDSSSDSDSDSGDAPGTSVEWLATGRAKRSTAGNRMKSLLATETPADEDSDLELLFQEDEDDVGFSDKDNDDGSDAAMESSDDEDENEVQDEDAGEKELERQAKEKRAAARKRKAHEAIPAKFRKKVRIHPPEVSGAGIMATPAPRPKKKSERASWLPTEAEMPTRASGRKTTQLSKEQLHREMIGREARRLKQVEIMERQAKKKEALKKPPMTQAERLKEAAIVEKRNAKSLNRWEEAEKQREEERRAKLAALNNRRLEGPVVTFWTGIIDLSEVQLKHVGKMVTMEEKPKRKRPSTAVGKEAAPTTEPKTESGSLGAAQETPITQETPILPHRPETPREPEVSKTEAVPATPVGMPPSTLKPPQPVTSLPTGTVNPFSVLPSRPPVQPLVPFQPTSSPTFRSVSPATAPVTNVAAPLSGPHYLPAGAPPAASAPQGISPVVKKETLSSKPMPLALRPDVGPRFMPPPNPHFARPPQANPLVPPAGSSNGQPQPPGGYAATPVPRGPSLGASASIPAQPPSSLNPPQAQAPSISPPTTTNTLSTFSGPYQPPAPNPSPKHTTASFQPIIPTAVPVKGAKNQQTDPSGPKKPNGKAAAPRKAPAPIEPPVPEPPMEGKVTRTCIILQDFDADAIKKPEVQTQILFGWKMSRLAKPPHPPLCAITNQVARHKDPKTGLPYYNAYAFKEIQKLTKGDFRWSKLTNTWVGNGTDAAKGVPNRFTRPETEEEVKERLERKKAEEKLAEEKHRAEEHSKPAEVADAAQAPALKAEEESGSVPMHTAEATMPNAPPLPTSSSPTPPSAPALAAPNMASPSPVPVGKPAPASTAIGGVQPNASDI